MRWPRRLALQHGVQGEYSAMPPNDGAPARRSRTSGTENAHVLAAGSVHRLPQVDQAVAVAVRQRLEQHAADDAEDRGVGADAEREGEHDDRGERRRFRRSARTA